MGSIIGKAMDDNMKKQQEFMLKTQMLQMERQIHMQNEMRERMMAMQIARSRDMVMWFGSFYTLAAFGCIMGFLKRKTPGPLVPLLPLTFIFGYQYDMAYGNKINRMQAEADRVLDDERGLLYMPHGIPTIAGIDAARIKQKDEDRLSQSHDLFL